MKHKVTVTVGILLIFTSIGLGIFAHVTYLVAGKIGTKTLGLGGAAILSLVISYNILYRATRNKPIDLGTVITTSPQRAMSGSMLLGLAAILLLFVAPQIYQALVRDYRQLGTGMTVDEFPIDALRPALRWLLEKLGAIGPVLPFVALGIFCLVAGWRLIKPKRQPGESTDFYR